MTTTTILSDNGVSSGSAGIKTTGGNDGTLALQTTTAGGTATTAVTIDTSQNVGIGASTLNDKLNLYSSTSVYQRFQNSTTGTGATDGFQIGNDASAAYIWNYEASSTIFATSNTERMRIDSSGNLLVGTTSASPTNNNSFYCATPNGALGVNHVSGSSSGNTYIAFSYNAGVIGSIVQNGTAAVAYNTTSDYRLKENVQPIANALGRIAALKPCTYTWKSAPDEIGEGFIAHELAEVCPQAVTGEKDAVDEDGNPRYQSIDTSFLVATLTAAIQEQQAIIQTLEARLAALEAK